MIVEVQDELLRGLKISPQRLQLEAAIGFYTSDDVTLGQAAAIAGLSQSDFLHELGRRGVCVHYDVEEFEQDLQTLTRLGRLEDR
jgi:predicted HTH domain antitoxin